MKVSLMRPYLCLSLARLNIYMKSTVVAKVPAAAYFAFVCCSALDGTCKIHLILAHIYHTIFENKLHTRTYIHVDWSPQKGLFDALRL